MAQPELAWVDVQACTLPTAERPTRLAEFDDVFVRHLVGTELESATQATMSFNGGEDTARLLEDLTARESRCCSFFDFAVTTSGDNVDLRVAVPSTQADVLTALVARANSLQAQGHR